MQVSLSQRSEEQCKLQHTMQPYPGIIPRGDGVERRRDVILLVTMNLLNIIYGDTQGYTMYTIQINKHITLNYLPPRLNNISVAGV